MNIIRTQRRRQRLRVSVFAVIAALAVVSAMLMSYVSVESYIAITANR